MFLVFQPWFPIMISVKIPKYGFHLGLTKQLVRQQEFIVINVQQLCACNNKLKIMFVISKWNPTFSSCLIKMKLDAELGILIPNIHLFCRNMILNEFLDYFHKCPCKLSCKTWDPILLTLLSRIMTLKELQKERGDYINFFLLLHGFLRCLCE